MSERVERMAQRPAHQDSIERCDARARCEKSSRCVSLQRLASSPRHTAPARAATRPPRSATPAALRKPQVAHDLFEKAPCHAERGIAVGGPFEFWRSAQARAGVAGERSPRTIAVDCIYGPMLLRSRAIGSRNRPARIDRMFGALRSSSPALGVLGRRWTGATDEVAAAPPPTGGRARTDRQPSHVRHPCASTRRRARRASKPIIGVRRVGQQRCRSRRALPPAAAGDGTTAATCACATGLALVDRKPAPRPGPRNAARVVRAAWW